MGEVLGAVDERSLSAKLFRGEAKLTDKISEHMGERLPVIGSLEGQAELRKALSEEDAVMVTFVGAPIGILTRHDLLANLNK
jgi:cystathionine beta-synthase